MTLYITCKTFNKEELNLTAFLNCLNLEISIRSGCKRYYQFFYKTLTARFSARGYNPNLAGAM